MKAIKKLLMLLAIIASVGFISCSDDDDDDDNGMLMLMMVKQQQEQAAKNREYTLSFNSAYPEGSGLKAISQNDSSKIGYYTLMDNPFTVPEGYYFVGWKVSGSSDEAQVLAAKSEVNILGDTSFDAVWQKIKTITVTYISGDDKKAQSAYAGEVKLEENTFKKEGFNFLGWSAVKDSEKVQYKDEATVTLTSDTTLYAIWTTKTSTTLTYDANDGSTKTIEQEVSLLDTQVTLKENPFYRSGYYLLGYSLSKSAEEETYREGEKVSISDVTDKTLYAVWIKTSDCVTITYYDESYGYNTTIQHAKKRSNVTLIPNSFANPGQVFKGWATEPSILSQPKVVYNDKELIYVGDEDLTLYGVWASGVTLTFYQDNSNDAKSFTITCLSGDVIEAADINAKFTEAGFEKKNVTFMGWTTSIYDITVKYEPTSDIVASSSTKFYGLWETVYTITYHGNGGLTADKKDSFTQETYGSKSYKIALNPFTREGYAFKGWGVTKTQSYVTYEAGDTGQKLHTDIDLYAIWEASYYTLTIDANGGIGSQSVKAIKSSSGYGAEAILPECTIKRSGYYCYGYTSQPYGDSNAQLGKLYAHLAGDKVNIIEDTTYYVLWLSEGSGGQEKPEVKNIVSFYNGSELLGEKDLEITDTETEYDFDLGARITYNIVTLPTDITPTKAGCVFFGWSPKKELDDAATSGGGVPGKSYAILEDTKKLYALWVKEEVKISYNKGTLGSSLLGSVDDTVIKTANNMEEYKKESSTMYRIKAKLSSDVLVGRQTHIKGESYLSGIAFYGWTNEERWKDYYCTGTVDILDKDSTAYRPGANIYITGDTEVYPVLIGAKADSKTPYNLENVISVTCNQNDYLHAFTGEATWVDANEYIYTFIKGEPFTLPHHEVTNYKTSYKFVGWTDKDVSGPKLAGSYTVADADYEDEHHFNASDTDIYLYALWQK